MKSGIYSITCLANGKRYIGSAANLRARWNCHLNQLRRHCHGNRHLQGTFDKHGEAAFFFEVVEHVSDLRNLVSREQFFIDHYQSANPVFGLNLAPRAGSQLGVKFSEECKRRMSEKRMGHVMSEEWCKKIGDSLRGRKQPQHVKDAVGRANKGRKASDETKRKQSLARVGFVRSEETCRRLSLALKGVKKSAEHVAKMAVKHRHLTDAQVNESTRLFKEGFSLAKLGPMFAVNPETITNNFRRIGFDYRPFLMNRPFICPSRIPARVPPQPNAEPDNSP